MALDPKAPSPEESPGTPDRWFMLSLLAFDYFVLYLHRNLINYFQPPLEADLDIGKFELGLLRWGLVAALIIFGVGTALYQVNMYVLPRDYRGRVWFWEA